MRTITLVPRHVLSDTNLFSGNVVSDALCFGDIDHDGDTELVIGTIHGHLIVLKYGQVVWSTMGLGTISAIEFGEVGRKFNHSEETSTVNKEPSRAVYVASAEGKLHIITFEPSGSSNNSSNKLNGKIETVQIPVNISRLLIGDVDGDGEPEVILARTDRFLHSFGIINQHGKTILNEKKRWALEEQIGSLALLKDHDGRPVLAVAQAGGSAVLISDGVKKDIITVPKKFVVEESILLGDESNNNTREKDFQSAILTEIASTSSASATLALTTVKGTVTVCDVTNPSEARTLCLRLPRNHLFAVAFTEEGDDGDQVSNIVACTWAGSTYFIDQKDFSIVKFDFHDQVSAFLVGKYAIAPGRNVTCLVYVTLNDEVYIYSDVPKRIQSRNLVQHIGEIDPTILERIAKKRNVDLTDPVAVQKMLSDYVGR